MNKPFENEEVEALFKQLENKDFADNFISNTETPSSNKDYYNLTFKTLLLDIFNAKIDWKFINDLFIDDKPYIEIKANNYLISFAKPKNLKDITHIRKVMKNDISFSDREDIITLQQHLTPQVLFIAKDGNEVNLSKIPLKDAELFFNISSIIFDISLLFVYGAFLTDFDNVLKKKMP